MSQLRKSSLTPSQLASRNYLDIYNLQPIGSPARIPASDLRYLVVGPQLALAELKTVSKMSPRGARLLVATDKHC
jgi:hypothetical protein